MAKYPAHQPFRIDYDFPDGTIEVTLSMGTKAVFTKHTIGSLLTFLHTVSCLETRPPADRPLTRAEIAKLCEGKPITRALAPAGKATKAAPATLSLDDLDL